MRRVVDEYPGRVLIGETWTSTPQELAEYYGPHNDELQLPMYFNFTTINKLDAARFRQRIEAVETNSAGGWPVFVLSNHDIIRQVDRYTPPGADKDQVARLLAALYLTLRGTPILYMGEELGMHNNDPLRREDVKDVIGRLGWPKEKGRDGERTPMQWDATVNAGFNQGAATWLPVGSDYKTRNVAVESADPASVLNWYRRLIELRRTVPALSEGDYNTLPVSDEHLLAFSRTLQGKTVVVLLNMSGDEQTVSLADLAPRGLRALATSAATMSGAQVKLSAYGALVAEVE